MRAHSSRRSASVAASAAAIATIPGTLCVPLRRSRSCPPPTSSGSMVTPLRTTSTPTPLGPPNLWALSDIRSTCGQSWRRSSQHAACTASVCSNALGAAARTTSATAREVVDRADLVVHRHHRHDRHVVVERGGELIEVGPAVLVDADDPSVVTLDDVEHAVVLASPGTPVRHRGATPRRRSPRCRSRCRRS